MPVSKNRKKHKSKLKLRKQLTVERKNKVEKMYRETLAQLQSKYASVPDMLNRESGPPQMDQTTLDGNVHDSPIKPGEGLLEYINSIPPNEKRVNRDNFMTVDMPEFDPSEPVAIYSPRVVLSDEEQAEQDAIIQSAVLTTNATPLDENIFDVDYKLAELETTNDN